MCSSVFGAPSGATIFVGTIAHEAPQHSCYGVRIGSTITSKGILVTGATRGIGRATASHWIAGNLMKSEKLIAVLCGGIICLAVPLYWQQITSVANYWSAGQSAALPFSAESDTRNTLIVGALCASTLMAPIALAALALQGFEKLRKLSFVLYLLAIASLLCFVVCQLVLYNQYGGAGRHLGQIAMAIHSGMRAIKTVMGMVSRTAGLKAGIIRI